MKLAFALALAAFAPTALACTTPAAGTLEDMMAATVWTQETGSNYRPDRNANVRIALPALAAGGFGCLQWNVELLLGAGMAVKDGGATTYTALAASATATFALVLDAPAHEVRYETAVLRVKVRNPNADPGVVLHRPSGSPVWLFPVRVQFAND